MKKVIEQPGIVNLNIQVSTNDDLDITLSQSNNFTHDEIRIIKSKAREVALAIYPELESELKEAVELIKLFHSLPDVLSNSLGDCSEGNDYEIISINGERWINHKGVGSGEPLKQWIKSEIDKSLNK